MNLFLIPFVEDPSFCGLVNLDWAREEDGRASTTLSMVAKVCTV